jgi:hypothetical protein
LTVPIGQPTSTHLLGQGDASTRPSAELTAHAPPLADSLGGSLNTADNAVDPRLTRPACHRLTTFTPALADSVGSPLNTADHALDRGANHPARHRCRGIGHPGPRPIRARSARRSRLCHEPLPFGTGGHCPGLRRSRRRPRCRVGRADAWVMAPAAPSCTSCADSNTIGGLRTHYQRIVFGTTPGQLTLRGPSTDIGCLRALRLWPVVRCAQGHPLRCASGPRARKLFPAARCAHWETLRPDLALHGPMPAHLSAARRQPKNGRLRPSPERQ